MRRVLCVAALFFAAGCGSSTPSTATSSAAPPPAQATSAAASASPSGSSKQEVCDQIKAINAQYTGQVSATFQKMADQLVKGDQAGAAKTMDELKAQATEWGTKIEPLVAKTDDPQLKAALQNLLDGVKKLQAGTGSLSDLQKLATDANAAIAKYCS